jgi:CheY-like chemotaxis protein
MVASHEQHWYLANFLLERHGYAVVSTPDGPRGIELARRSPPDLILLDIQLPTMGRVHGGALPTRHRGVSRWLRA